MTNHYGMGAQITVNYRLLHRVSTMKSDHELSEDDYEKIVEWEKNILPEGNRLKGNFYAAKSMMKPFGLGY
jgi:hypothetical protein